MQGFEQSNIGLCQKVGKMVYDEMLRQGIPLKESMNLREDVNLTDASGMYTTALQTVLQAASEPDQIGKELLKENRDLMNGKGKGAIKIPKDVRTAAIEVAEGAVTDTSARVWTQSQSPPRRKWPARKSPGKSRSVVWTTPPAS